MTDMRLVYCTFPSAEEAQSVAEVLIRSGLAACVSVSQPMRSVYRWEGQLCCENEVQMTVKTTSAALEAVFARVTELHSYDCPELLAVPVVKGSAGYLQWAADQVRST